MTWNSPFSTAGARGRASTSPRAAHRAGARRRAAADASRVAGIRSRQVSTQRPGVAPGSRPARTRPSSPQASVALSSGAWSCRSSRVSSRAPPHCLHRLHLRAGERAVDAAAQVFRRFGVPDSPPRRRPGRWPTTRVLQPVPRSERASGSCSSGRGRPSPGRTLVLSLCSRWSGAALVLTTTDPLSATRAHPRNVAAHRCGPVSLLLISGEPQPSPVGPRCAPRPGW